MKRIPIKAAREISEKYNCPEVVIFAYDPKSGKQHVTTYGETFEQSEDAAKAGNYLKKALGWPEELCNAKPENVPVSEAFDSIMRGLAEVKDHRKKVGRFLFKITLDSDDDFCISNRYLENDSPYFNVIIELEKKEDIIEFIKAIEIKPKYDYDHYMTQFRGYIEEVNCEWKKRAVKEIRSQIRAKENVYYDFGGNHEITIEEFTEKRITPIKINIKKD